MLLFKPNKKYTEILRLDAMLTAAGIPHCIRPNLDGYQLRYPTETMRVCEVIECMASLGRKDNLLELSGLLTEEEEKKDSVLGGLSAEEVFRRIKAYHEGWLNTKPQSIEIRRVFYVCDRKKCEKCHDECRHTSDIEHAANFIQVGGNFTERDDAVPVVQCKECKYYYSESCLNTGFSVDSNWYCADGERKDGAD